MVVLKRMVPKGIRKGKSNRRMSTSKTDEVRSESTEPSTRKYLGKWCFVEIETQSNTPLPFLLRSRLSGNHLWGPGTGGVPSGALLR